MFDMWPNRLFFILQNFASNFVRLSSPEHHNSVMRSSPKRIEGLDGRNLQLHFKYRISLPLFTGGKVEGEQGAAIHNVEGKRPLLTGDLQVTLKEGVGTLGDLIFTDNSSWIRSRKFRLGLKVALGYCENYKKHYPPALNDDVWRLEKIGKDGSFHKRLNNAGIFTVEDFLRLAVRDSQKLRNILGSGMSNRMWDTLIEHSKTCGLNWEALYILPDDSRNVGVVFNNIYELSGLIANDQYNQQIHFLTARRFVYVDTLVKKAYDNWNQVVEYDGKSFLNFKQIKKSSVFCNNLPMGPVNYPDVVENPLPPARLPASVTSEPLSMIPSMLIGGSSYNDNTTARYPPIQSQVMSSSSCTQFDSPSFTRNDHHVNHPQHIQSPTYDNRVGLALGPSQPPSSSSQMGNSSIQQTMINPFEDWSHNQDKGVDDFLSEEEIRTKSHEMLENEDMQHLLRLFSMGGHASVNVPEDGYGFSSYLPSPSPSFSYNEDRTRSGKAVVGWLKIKAAMRWGIFVRKKAAERRAELVELEDE
ncbi:Calmodulin-binding protein 60 B [Abeliophyllum distichum]|uniref:Calmodulin-binding protein 60 B n=1 Tax=Abeliophyllum distichum TaxID=126358 RepID=A0ABD1PPB2_9LAMI